MLFRCEILGEEVNSEDCALCDKHDECKKSGYFNKISKKNSPDKRDSLRAHLNKVGKG